jgi:excisionase family DNA binding protein
MQPKIYRINVAATKLGVSRNTIYRLVKSGKLALVKIGERVSGITTASIDALIK